MPFTLPSKVGIRNNSQSWMKQVMVGVAQAIQVMVGVAQAIQVMIGVAQAIQVMVGVAQAIQVMIGVAQAIQVMVGVAQAIQVMVGVAQAIHVQCVTVRQYTITGLLDWTGSLCNQESIFFTFLFFV